MFCIKCGTSNPDDAEFCRKCGTEIAADDEETRLSAKRTPDDAPAERIFSIHPTLKFVALGYCFSVIAAFAVVVILNVLVANFAPLFGVIIGLLLLLVPVYFHAQQKLVRYTLTDTTLQIDRGLISRNSQIIPLRRVQDVTVTSSIFQRMLGYGDISIDNAGEDGVKIVLDNIDRPTFYAGKVLAQMRRLDS